MSPRPAEPGSREIRVSVVTVNLNHARGMRRTRDSVLAQTARRCLEWIVVDGASSDTSVACAREAENVVALNLTSEADSGVYDAMNKGWRRATGDLVVFMNSGDSFADEHVLERTIERWEAGGWRWGYGCARALDPNGAPFTTKEFAPFRLDRLALGLATVPHQATYMTRSLLEQLGGFDESFPIAADQELMLRAAQLEKPAVWIDFLADFEHGGIGSLRGPRDHARDMRHATRKNHVSLYGSAWLDSLASFGVEFTGVALAAQSRYRSRRSAEGRR